jgi:hypothetical protein
VTGAKALATLPVGVIVERRRAKSPWVDFTWKPVSVLPGTPAAAPWTVLCEADEGATFYAGPAEIALYRSETSNYRDNLAGSQPRLWVALRATGVEPPFEVFAVTVDPAEAEALTEAGNDVVEAVDMPDVVRTAVEAFISEHHVERPFYKRKRDRADPQALARHSPVRKQWK